MSFKFTVCNKKLKKYGYYEMGFRKGRNFETMEMNGVLFIVGFDFITPISFDLISKISSYS